MAKSDMTCIYRGFAFTKSEILNNFISSGPKGVHLEREKKIVLALGGVAFSNRESHYIYLLSLLDIII